MFDIANQAPDGYKVFGWTRTTRHKSPGAARSPCWRTTASAADAASSWRTAASAADAACSATACSWGRGAGGQGPDGTDKKGFHDEQAHRLCIDMALHRPPSLARLAGGSISVHPHG